MWNYRIFKLVFLSLKLLTDQGQLKKSCVDNVTCRRTAAEESESMFVSVFILQDSEYIKRC